MTARPGDPALERDHFTYSIVIPVYNSEPLVGETVDRRGRGLHRGRPASTR